MPSELCGAGGGGCTGGSAGSSVLVPLHVQRQVVGAREAAVAHAALEGLGPGVLAVVAGQLIRAREPPVAAFPGAFVRLLTCATDQEGKVSGQLATLDKAGSVVRQGVSFKLSLYGGRYVDS